MHQMTLFAEMQEAFTPPVVPQTTKVENPTKTTRAFEPVERIDEDVLIVLRHATIENGVLSLPEQERSLYEKVDELLKRLFGKWNRRAGGHIFPFGQDVLQPLVTAMLETGKMPEKNPLAYFKTPYDVIDDLVSGNLAEHLDWWEKNRIEYDLYPIRILEPSAGTGALADYITERWPNVTLDLVEIDELNVRLLKSKGYRPTHGDFTEFEPEHEYDVVIMNPPFSVKGDANAFITHIRKAYGHLRPGGQLLGIVPPGFKFRSDAIYREFLNFVALHGHWWDFPEGSFKESGTNIATCGIDLKYDPWSDKHRKQEFNGWPNFDMWLLQLHADNWYEYQQFENRMIDKLCADESGLNIVGLPARKSMLKQWRRWYDDVFVHANKMGDGFVKENLDIDYLIRHTIESYLLESYLSEQNAIRLEQEMLLPTPL